eukprot:3736281-Pyramimonas_sp.AAC.1
MKAPMVPLSSVSKSIATPPSQPPFDIFFCLATRHRKTLSATSRFAKAVERARCLPSRGGTTIARNK